MTIINQAQKEALYQKYSAIHHAYKSDPLFFTLTQSNTELTTVMGGRAWSWHVVGITKAALLRYKELDFKHVARSGITRAHLVPRFFTTEKLLSKPTPYSLNDFFRFGLKLIKLWSVALVKTKKNLQQSIWKFITMTFDCSTVEQLVGDFELMLRVCFLDPCISSILNKQSYLSFRSVNRQY